jgi:hypothetical protein
MTVPSEYPEHEKLAKVSDESNAIGDFIMWLESKGTHLMQWNDSAEDWLPDQDSIVSMLAAYYDIDLKKIEQEKREMLNTMREMNE